jgi:hypothetical protein
MRLDTAPATPAFPVLVQPASPLFRAAAASLEIARGNASSVTSSASDFLSYGTSSPDYRERFTAAIAAGALDTAATQAARAVNLLRGSTEAGSKDFASGIESDVVFPLQKAAELVKTLNIDDRTAVRALEAVASGAQSATYSWVDALRATPKLVVDTQ